MKNTSIRVARRAGAALLALAGLTAGATGQTEALQPNWSFQSDGSWLPGVVSLGNAGTQVFTEIGSFSTHRLLLSGYDQDPPSPVWSDGSEMLHFHQVVDSADTSDVHVVLVQEQPIGLPYRRAVLRKYTSASADPDWEYVFDVDVYNHPYASVKVSKDGTRIVGVVHDTSTNRAVVAVFDAANQQPQQVFNVDTFGPYQQLSLSEDGTTLALRSSQKLSVVSLDGGETVDSVFIIGGAYYGALDVSADGQRVATSSGQKVSVYERGAQGLGLIREIQLGAYAYTYAVDLSEDGERLAYGRNDTQQPGRAEVRLEIVETGARLIDFVQPGTGEFYNKVGHLELSSDGGTLAAGLAGDGTGAHPEVLVFSAGSDVPQASFDTPGTVLALDLSHDGRALAIGAREGHSSVFGGGGGYYFIDTCSADLSLTGVPSVGSTVRFGQQAMAGTPTRLLYASALAAEPRVFGSTGTLYLSEGSLSVLPGVAVADGNGVAKTDYSIPNSSTLIGTSVYFQGLGMRPRQLTEDYVKMTILP